MTSMVKRVVLFALVNILMVITISTILSLLGVRPYLSARGINYGSLMVFCLIWGKAGSFISLLLSKFMAKMMMGVTILDPHGPHQHLVNTVHHLATKAGLTTMPEVGIYESPELNAFATGPSRSNSLVAVSSGLLERMRENELTGVLAHEISHIANGDMVTMTLVQGIINAFVMFFARLATFGVDVMMRNNSDEREGNGGGGLGFFAHHLVLMLFETVFGLLGMIVVAWFSRWREFRADSGAADLAGKNKMIAALQCLARHMHEQIDNDGMQGQEQTATASIRSLKISGKSGSLQLLPTHPPLEKRIEALSQMTMTA